MITYQVEVMVPLERAEEWVEYMTSKHIADVVSTGMFESASLQQVVDPSHNECVVYRVRYQCANEETLATYRSEFAPSLQADHTRIFGTDVKAVRSVSEEILQLRGYPRADSSA